MQRPYGSMVATAVIALALAGCAEPRRPPASLAGDEARSAARREADANAEIAAHERELRRQRAEISELRGAHDRGGDDRDADDRDAPDNDDGY